VKHRRAQSGTAAGGLTVISALAAAYYPVLAIVALTVVLIVGAVCWVVADPARARNLALLIDVTRGGNRHRPPR
jgi:hypothetical protein